jgi:hypothetical protein
MSSAPIRDGASAAARRRTPVVAANAGFHRMDTIGTTARNATKVLREHKMSEPVVISWLNDASLSRLASQGVSDPSIWEQRYDAACPSEFYRGYATVLAQVGEAFRLNASPAALGQQIDGFDSAIKRLPDDERRNGASVALKNVYGYAEAGTAAQISATLVAELVCIARCFVQNRARRL